VVRYICTTHVTSISAVGFPEIERHRNRRRGRALIGQEVHTRAPDRRIQISTALKSLHSSALSVARLYQLVFFSLFCVRCRIASFGSDCAICSHRAVLGADFGILLPVTNSGLETAFFCLCYHFYFFCMLFPRAVNEKSGSVCLKLWSGSFEVYVCSRSSKTDFLVQICGVLESSLCVCVGV
jgi:hypothetical protein